jgi:phosphoenolpyruvate carboxykinase (ATP)
MPSSSLQHLIVQPRQTIANPTTQQLHDLVAQMPTARASKYGNLNVSTKVLARSKACTYIVTDTPNVHSDQCISRAEGTRIAQMQDAFIREQTMVVIDGYIGADTKRRVAARLMVEAKFANIAAMQAQLYFTPTPEEYAQFKPVLQIIYTPSLGAPGYANDRIIAVDLEHNVTRVLNSDYFGESKKAGLRMWNKIIYDGGGLPMHAGCKSIPVANKRKVGLIIGLSGTGKTTTTFTRQNDSQPLQDDFVALMPDGAVVATENGCFAKTYGLDPQSEPMIYGAVTQPAAYLENVSMKADGTVDFFDESYTQNGRATFPFALLSDVGDVRSIPHADFILILNRNENIIPAVAKLDRAQGAAYFMLGETKGTAAGGAEEAGRALRVPGTNPFFPLLHAQQGARFLELMQKLPCDIYLMNTGWVGGANGTEHSKKVKIRHSSAVVKGIAEGNIDWVRDPDFGYSVAQSVPGLGEEDADVLRPAAYYARCGRQQEYARIVASLKADRQTHLRKFSGLPPEIAAAVA